MKLGLKDMKKEYKKVNLDEIEVWPFCCLCCLCYFIHVHIHVMSGLVENSSL